MEDSIPIINYGVKDGDVFYMEKEGKKDNYNFGIDNGNSNNHFS